MTPRIAVSFTNLGPYHLARLRALGEQIAARGGALLAIETAARETRYPWSTPPRVEPFQHETLFPNAALDELSARDCRDAMRAALDEFRPQAVAVAGYVRPECLEAARWCRTRRAVAILMSESQEIDHPRAWWKEAVKARRVRRFDAALAGGPSHRAYLEQLGMPAGSIALGYNAVDHDRIVAAADSLRRAPRPQHVPQSPYFLAVSRMAPEKNLDRLLVAYAGYRARAGGAAWPLVICGDGPCRDALNALRLQFNISAYVHITGFLQERELDPFYAFASAFVLASKSEPWGLVVNEAAAAGQPLVVSSRAGCVETFVPQGAKPTGRRIDPLDVHDIENALVWMGGLGEIDRSEMARAARTIAAQWGPARFAEGFLEALQTATAHSPSIPSPAPRSL